MVPFGTTVMPSGVTVKPRARSFSVSMPTVEFSVSTTFLSRIAFYTRARRLTMTPSNSTESTTWAHEWMRTFGDSTE